MNRLRLSWLDPFVVVCAAILLTSGEYFIKGSILDYVRLHPSHHRLFLSVITGLLLSVVFFKHNKNQLYQESFLFGTFQKLRLKPLHWVSLIFIMTSSVFAYSSYIRHHVFRTSFDLSIFAQAIWNTWRGDFFYSSIKGGINLMGDHMSPILAFFAPVYFFGDSPVPLLILQAIFASSAVFPIYLIGKRVFGDEKLATLFAALYALYLPLRNAVRFDFHPEVAADVLILWGFYFLFVSRLWWSSFFLFLTLLIKENACLPVAAVGFYAFCFQKKFIFGALWMSMAVATFLVDIYVVAPYYLGAPYFYSSYLELKSTDALGSIVNLIQGSTFNYLKKIYLPLGFFSFLSPSTFLLTAPMLVQNLTTGGVLHRSIFFQYTAFLTPFVFVSAIFGFKNFLNLLQKYRRDQFLQWKKFAVYWLIGWSFLLTGVSEYHVVSEHHRLDSPHLEYIRRYLKAVPNHVSVRTHELFAPHVANRKELHIYENEHPREGGSTKAQNADLVILDDRFLKDIKKEAVIITKEMQIKQLKANGYRLIHEHDGFYVFSRNSAESLWRS